MNIYEKVKFILKIIYEAGSVCVFIFLIRWLFLLLSKNPDKKKRHKTAKVLLLFFIISFTAIVADVVISAKQYAKPVDINDLPKFNVTSDNLKNGVWDEQIGAKHGNVSPELSWDKNEYAAKYAIVMIDHDGNDWLHWFALTDKTSVDEGTFNGENNGYVGPYPPSGTHNYTVYVFALKGDTNNPDIQLDKGGTELKDIIDQLNSGRYDNDYNNIKSVGIIEGSYSAD